MFAKMNAVVCLIPAILICVLSADIRVRVSETHSDHVVTKVETIDWNDTPVHGSNNLLTVDDTTTFQDVDGLGVTLSDSSAWLLWNKMNRLGRQKLLTKLFKPNYELGLQTLRIYIGASAFSVSNYTYDDTCCDLADFSVQRDKEYIIPIILEALKINPDLKIFAISQSPPAWMKTNENLIGGYLNEKYFQMFAEYLALFVRSYEKEGVPIYAVLIQDEPEHFSRHPSMWMVPSEQSYLLRTKINPVFVYNNLKTKLLVSSQNWDMLERYGDAVLKIKGTQDAVSGVGFTCYNGEPQDQQKILLKYPDEDLWLIECTDEKWDGGINVPGLFGRAMRREIMGSFLNGARGVMKFNLALDTKSGPSNGGCQVCLGMFTITENGTAEPNTAVWAYMHVGSFLRKGAKRIDTYLAHPSLQNVAFVNDDREVVLVVFNNATSTQTVTVRWNTHSFTYELKSNSAGTFAWGTDSTLEEQDRNENE